MTAGPSSTSPSKSTLNQPLTKTNNITSTTDAADSSTTSLPPPNSPRTISSGLFPFFQNSVVKFALSSVIALYILNQNHLLPKPLSAIVSKTLFWPTLPITMVKRINKWSNTQIDDTVVMGGAPFNFLNIPNKLYHDYNVRGVINLCEEYKGPTKIYDQMGIQELWLPTTDHFEPSVGDLIKAVKFIQQYKDENTARETPERVYIHCRAGHGRSAAVVYAWLLSQERDIENVDMKRLNEKLSSLRNVRTGLWKQPNVNKFRSWLELRGMKSE